MSAIWILLVIILISSIPVFAVYIWFRIAKYQFTPVRFLFALLAGAAAFFPALLLQNFLTFSYATTGRLALLLQVFVRVAFTEEISRLLMLFLFFLISSRINPQESIIMPLSYNTIRNGAATGLIAGLGFALLESAVYGASNSGILMLRVFTAAPLHGACGSRIGAAAVLFRTNPIQALLRVVTATAIHGVYNFMVTIPGVPSVAAVLIAISALLTAIISINTGGEAELQGQSV
ncbi:MAG: PrsW family glutamic-type intramembrane protease [Treponema sp.]|nr:PrsW family glutamic-type intramembrane protease [Treponema sp.]